jgi:hypothetical protein
MQQIPFIIFLNQPHMFRATISPETCRVGLKRSIKGICCIMLVVYIVVLVMYGHTNIKPLYEL